MPVTAKIAEHEAFLINSGRPVVGPGSPGELLKGAHDRLKDFDLIQSSFKSNHLGQMFPSRHGFVFAVMEAYNQHHHLTIRPDDIWLAITTQFAAYVNAHAEKLRKDFVQHEGQKNLAVHYGCGNRYMIDFGDFAQKIGDLIERNIVDPELRKWITPAFSTTTKHDVVASQIIMMGSLQAYFKYTCRILCGIPSVTLLGEREDYQNMLHRIEKLGKYGAEPTDFYKMLRPVLQGFVKTFDQPEGAATKEFWSNAFREGGTSGGEYYNGWITKFCFWDTDGKRQLQTSDDWIDSNDVPCGFTAVPVTINDNGQEVEAEMLAGSVGYACMSSGRLPAKPLPSQPDPDVGLDTVQPQIGWFIYEKKDPKPENH
ncbi:hypothetical protein EJ04DRAFT_516911 [Polyplosphaeria fusca]|uniref:Uncharacterized protein n=1 Tax=Polyplosphaeria fusca TaxID=682080 RepID=A0A9P4UWM8_9PLEO|nr:hypothetical protein EJ04DRAFT_516911 [Polyplosphaeria fusca]